MTALILPRQSGTADEAYRVLLRHTMDCATCRTSPGCPVALRLGRAWRENRR